MRDYIIIVHTTATASTSSHPDSEGIMKCMLEISTHEFMRFPLIAESSIVTDMIIIFVGGE